jgi:SAM-dependent methyltransferase
MSQASKTRTLWGSNQLQLISGDGIDIGCGPDPITSRVTRFDQEDGDANFITRYVSRKFDFVFSSHCLEHMRDPQQALQEWWSLVKDGGHLILIVPDEILYEQGYWPSIFNGDHKWTFRIGESITCSPRSIEIGNALCALPGARIISIVRQDDYYDYSLLVNGEYPRWLGRKLKKLWAWLHDLLSRHGLAAWSLAAARRLRIPVDQTRGPAVAQIQAIVQKQEHFACGE